MEIKQVRSLLNEIDQLDQGNERFALIEKAEKVLPEYLMVPSSDIEIWYSLVLLKLIFLHDEFEAIQTLQEIWEKFHDERAVILIAFIKEEFLGGVEENDFSLLTIINPYDTRMQACKEKFISNYYKKIRPEQEYLNQLSKSVLLYEKYVHAHLDIGSFYKEERQDKQAARHYFSKALNCIEKVFDDSDLKHINSFDLDAYFNEMVYGIHCTKPKYEYIKALAVGNEIRDIN